MPSLDEIYAELRKGEIPYPPVAGDLRPGIPRDSRGIPLAPPGPTSTQITNLDQKKYDLAMMSPEARQAQYDFEVESADRLRRQQDMEQTLDAYVSRGIRPPSNIGYYNSPLEQIRLAQSQARLDQGSRRLDEIERNNASREGFTGRSIDLREKDLTRKWGAEDAENNPAFDAEMLAAERKLSEGVDPIKVREDHPLVFNSTGKKGTLLNARYNKVLALKAMSRSQLEKAKGQLQVQMATETDPVRLDELTQTVANLDRYISKSPSNKASESQAQYADEKEARAAGLKTGDTFRIPGVGLVKLK